MGFSFVEDLREFGFFSEGLEINGLQDLFGAFETCFKSDIQSRD